ncbi:unnamed protein product [Cyprideis torosa]|uniref:Uncharacterized protein n=1 Tax=Cyprideis torosa TaxID=163714 RepID=A0A7R8WEX7_9CRUS|nr:unnamed protein product [Cyprideis torosa]CAG0896282.1 unnamed protein product [Cyprideis torosa]
MAACLTQRAAFRSSRFLPLCLSKARVSYVVLLPELDEDDHAPNSLVLNPKKSFPNFVGITPEKCEHAASRFAVEFENCLGSLEEHLKDQTRGRTFETVVTELDKGWIPLESTWGACKTLCVARSDILPAASYMNIHNWARVAKSKKYNNPILLSAFKEFDEDKSKLTATQARVLRKFLLEGMLNGSGLSTVGKRKLMICAQKLGESKASYELIVQEALGKFVHRIENLDIMHGIPDAILCEMAVNKSEPLIGPWEVTLKPYIYEAFIKHCHDSEIRWNAWFAMVTQSLTAKSTTSAVSLRMEQIRKGRTELARLLGYENFVDMSMQTKMAKNVVEVREMLNELYEPATEQQSRELTVLQTFAGDNSHVGRIDIWDIPYWRRRHYDDMINVPSSSLFPIARVIPNMTRFFGDLFGLKFTLASGRARLWAEDVQLYIVRDETTGEELGGICIDAFVRPGQKLQPFPGASWFIGCQPRNHYGPGLPLANLIFNFGTLDLNLQLEEEREETQLNIEQLEALLEKFGSAVLHVASASPYSEVAGVTNIEWDAAKTVPNFFKLWLREPWFLRLLCRDPATFDPSSSSLSEGIANRLALPHMIGYDLTKELYISNLDLDLYTKSDFWGDIVSDIWPEFFPFELDKMDAHPCGLTEIFSGDWAAAYYSNVWSKVMATDAFKAFEKCGTDWEDPAAQEAYKKTGKRFRDTFLSLGGSIHPSEVFRQFRGRDPSPDALIHELRSNPIYSTPLHEEPET